MIKIIVVDDEKAAVEELKYLLSQYEDIQVIGSYTDPKKALENILIVDADAVFLDISMPEIDGFVLAEAIMKLKIPPFIVFVTAYDEYAINAFEINAVDYLLKPVEEERLNCTIKRLREKMESTSKEQDEINTVIKKRYKEKFPSRIPLWKNDRIYLVKPDNIIYCTCSGGETVLFTIDDKFVSTDSLNHFDEILTPYNFFRCHRNFLIHLDDIKEIIPWFNNTYAVKMYKSDEKIPISRRKAKEFKERLNL